ncbi:hypothetical protein E2562_012092 [Oryza meyeriana var. granulata]|uniref:Nucleotide exchange factor Fes1 domain-containing protein n=1 Tax=Oryza meyeriana var. granulata TaxID=110450 RepID=A0A6G1F7B1_9ORYZ|nr:hypothetical protein E2562_012092 [Oryza meyeriana var. granulata]
MEPLLHRRDAAFSLHQLMENWVNCGARSDEERRWLAEAVERHMMVDVVSRMREIALLMSTPLSVLEAQGITTDDIEGLLAELQVHVESIDMANDLHSVGGLVPVIKYLRNSNARIRARAADVEGCLSLQGTRHWEVGVYSQTMIGFGSSSGHV